MFIIRRLSCIDAASGIVLSVSGGPVHSLRENCSAIQPHYDEHILLETCRGFNKLVVK